MISPNPLTPLVHGGDLGAARALFPDAPKPFLDLSTAINPHPYPIFEQRAEDFSHLPAPSSLDGLRDEAAKYYGAPSAENVVVAPGGQILMTLIAGQIRKGRAAILWPTYAEHARVAALAGHEVAAVTASERLGDANLAVAVNPNNPDGRVLGKEALLAIADRQRTHGGLLVVDEAFMDAGPRDESLCPHIEGANVVVLRSFGKFFGLAGLRLSFAVAARERAAGLRARLGPWPVSCPALSIGSRALGDRTWVGQTCNKLERAAVRLESLLCGAGLESVGHTSLFNLAGSAEAQKVFMRLGRAGIFVRRFEENPRLLRFGLPGANEDWARLENALRA